MIIRQCIFEQVRSAIKQFHFNGKQSRILQRNLEDIFWTIYETNESKRNIFNYTEIHSKWLRRIDHGHYLTMLDFLERMNLIKIRRNTATNAKSHCGLYVVHGVIICRPFSTGYRLSNSLISMLKDESIRDFIEVEQEDLITPKHDFTNSILLSQSLLLEKEGSYEEEEEIRAEEMMRRVNEEREKMKMMTLVKRKEEDSNVCIPNLKSNLLTITCGKKFQPTVWAMETCWNKITIDVEGMIEDGYLPEYIQRKVEKYANAKYTFKEGRWYGPFQQEREEEMKYLLIDGEHIREAGDAKTCHAQLLAKAVESCRSISDDEKRRFEDLVVNHDIYSEILKKIGDPKLTRKDIKRVWNQFVNISKQGLRTLERFGDGVIGSIDKWMKESFSGIRDFIVNFETIRVKNEKTGKTKIKKQLWRLLQKTEYSVISKITSDYRSRGAWPITKHDAVYLKESDYRQLGMDFSKLFGDIVEYQFM